MRNLMMLVLGLVLAFAAVLPAGARGESGPQPPIAEGESPEVAAARAKLADILRRLGDDDFQVREKASADLVALGPKAAPLVAAQVNHRDPEVAMRVKDGLLKLAGKPGPAVEGLTLAATLAGPKPRPGGVVTLWLTITNTSQQEISVFRNFWSLALQPEHQKGTGHARTIFAEMGAEVVPQDFMVLKPGESYGCLMDADPVPGAKGTELAQVYLEIALPGKAREAAKGKVFSGAEELVSGPIEMAYAGDAAAPDQAADALAESFMKGVAGAGDKLRPGQKDAAAAALALRALRSGLRRADDGERWKFFMFACQNPHPAAEDDVVDFLARWGPRLTSDDREMFKGLRGFVEVLPRERRPAFVQRVGLAMAHDWRLLNNLATIFMGSSDGAERAASARLFSMLVARGDRRPEVLSWLALELFATPDARLNDPKKAQELAELAIKAAPDRADYRFNLACIRGKKEDLEGIASQAAGPEQKNSMAWNLATLFPPGKAITELALKLAKEAVDVTDQGDGGYPFRVDTLAVCHAAQGDYVKALELEEKAFARMPANEDERGEYAARVARFTALAVAGKDERPARVLEPPRLRSTAARDALLARLKTEKEDLIRAEIKRLLQECFGADPEVVKALK